MEPQEFDTLTAWDDIPVPLIVFVGGGLDCELAVAGIDDILLEFEL